MFEVQFKENINEKIEKLRLFRLFAFKEARRSGLSSAGFLAMSKIRAYIESGGAGSWVKAHPLSVALRSRAGNWQKNRIFFGPYYWLGVFSRYKISAEATQVQTGFGRFSGKNAKKGQVTFDQRLMEIGRAAQTHRSIAVSLAMRRMLGATRQSSKSQAGVDFFPLRKTTAKLEIPARPIVEPVFTKIKDSLFTVFAQKFSVALKKRFEK